MELKLLSGSMHAFYDYHGQSAHMFPLTREPAVSLTLHSYSSLSSCPSEAETDDGDAALARLARLAALMTAFLRSHLTGSALMRPYVALSLARNFSGFSARFSFCQSFVQRLAVTASLPFGFNLRFTRLSLELSRSLARDFTGFAALRFWRATRARSAFRLVVTGFVLVLLYCYRPAARLFSMKLLSLFLAWYL